MKVYQANVKVKAVFYDGSEKSLEEVLEFCRTKTESRIELQMDEWYKVKKENKIFIIVKGYLGKAYVPLKANQYIVRYPSGIFYPYKKESFEKRFKEIA